MKSTAKRVLVVDDTPAMRELVTEIVAALGYCVSVAEDGKRALNFLKSNEEIEAIITDFNMPEMNGVELTKLIKANYRNTKVVFTSAAALDDFKAIAKEAGADEVLEKSEIVLRLSAILNSLIGPPISEFRG